MSSSLNRDDVPDSIFYWVFEASSGNSWGGWLVLDSSAAAPGDVIITARGRYVIQSETEYGIDLSGVGLADAEVHVEWYRIGSLGVFLPTLGGTSAVAGTAGLGSELDQAWTGSAWSLFGRGGEFQVDAADIAESPTPPEPPPPPPSTPLFTVLTNGVLLNLPATAYSGPVAGLQWQFLGSESGEVVGASDDNDFLNLLGGTDAADGRAGNDVLDGGTGSNFLTGGSGRDVFFLDGRGLGPTWATITDWEAGEQLSLFGWRPGVSTLTWVAQDGAPGFQGVTLHADLDGNGVFDASVTWAERSQGDLPSPLSFAGLLWFT
ncbi:hypothetical protein [Falsiroseomonas sp. HW251]|uniref:hypothetical protein n=1 Tax=Falsiroseomonas sp. HW251 TaxID=3390998 RepID=UPI003D31198D